MLVWDEGLEQIDRVHLLHVGSSGVELSRDDERLLADHDAVNY